MKQGAARDLREGLLAVLAEHCHHHVCYNSKLSLVCCSQINEHISSIKRNFRVLRVDDRRHRQYGTIGIVDNWVDGGFIYKVKVAG